MKNNLGKLRELTDRLPVLEKFVEDKEEYSIVYDVGEGECIGKGILNNDDVCVQVATLTEGTMFPLHRHDGSSETLVIISGSIRVFWDDGREELILNVGESVTFPKNNMHGVLALSDTQLVAVLIPHGGGYPDGPRS